MIHHDSSGFIVNKNKDGGDTADSISAIYSSSARTNVAGRLIGRLLSTQTTAGTWAANPTNASAGTAAKVRAYLPPTVQQFTSGSGTYTLPTSPRKPVYITVEMVGGGGGGACYLLARIGGSDLAATYAYEVGTGGTAGAAGTSGLVGGAGSSGKIIVTEFYQ